jgi:AraC-like DNA-binding protein
MPGGDPGEARKVIDEHAVRRPGEPLRPYVAWCTGYRQAGAEPAVHRGLPSPWLTMIVTLDEPLVIARHPDPGQPASAHDFLLGGLHLAPALVTHDGAQSGIQLAITPLGARALLGMPAAELAGIDVEAADVLGRLAAEVRGRVLAAPDWAGRFAVLEEFLAGRVRAAGERGAVPRPEVSYAWDRLRRARGAVSVADLAAETGWSARHLGKQFRAETGLSPKAGARVIRFDRARRRLLRRQAEDGRVVLAELAAECGYYDQAHLARDFRDLAGCPPSALLAEEFRNVQAALHGDWE